MYSVGHYGLNRLVGSIFQSNELFCRECWCFFVTCVAYLQDGILAFPHSLRASAHVPRNTPQSQTVRHTGDTKSSYTAQHEKRQPDPQKGSHITGSQSSYVNVHLWSVPHLRPEPRPSAIPDNLGSSPPLAPH